MKPKLSQDTFADLVRQKMLELFDEDTPSCAGYRKWEQGRATPNAFAIIGIATAAKVNVYDLFPSAAPSRSHRMLPAGRFLDKRFLMKLRNVRSENELAKLLTSADVDETWQLPVGCTLSASLAPITEEDFAQELESTREHLERFCPKFASVWTAINKSIERDLAKWRRRVTGSKGKRRG
jgi:hypothetical protein